MTETEQWRDEGAGWRETADLLSSPRNAERLRRGICQAENGTLLERELLTPDPAPGV